MRPLMRLSRPSTAVFGIGLFGVLGAFAYAGWVKHNRFNGTENYAIDFPPSLPGWAVMPPSPESLFMFKNKKTGVLMRGSVSQVISDVNPTPEEDTDGIAQYYIDRTHENMKDWTAVRVSDVQGKNVRFSVILRQRKEHTVITAYAVKGNTTLMVSMSSEKGDAATVKQCESDLTLDCSQISLRQTNMGGGIESETDDQGHPTFKG